jgi:hypothetical protein
MSGTRSDQAGQDTAHGLKRNLHGAAVILLSPQLARRVGAGLARDLGLPAGRVAGELEPFAADD